MRNTILTITACVAVTACSEIPLGNFAARGPEALLDTSSELVNVTLYEKGSVEELADWVNEDQPTRAEVYCLEGDPLCEEATSTLKQFGIPVRYTPTAENNIILIYERVTARDCESRFITNHVNPYNLNHPSFGCAMSVNMIQMVSDKQQFVNPNMLDLPDGEKQVQIYKAYLEPIKPPILQDDYKSLIESQ